MLLNKLNEARRERDAGKQRRDERGWRGSPAHTWDAGIGMGMLPASPQQPPGCPPLPRSLQVNQGSRVLFLACH